MKRTFDFIIAFCILSLAAPLFIFLALVVRYKLGSPIFFNQERIGLKGSIFKMHKFRTMTSTTDSDGNLLPDEHRLTRLGVFMRSSSLDELPELWNVLKGEMSLVGPRPLLVEYLPLYTPAQAQRHSILPGITGWAQVNGRNTTSWKERFELDLWYLENQSIWLDLKILVLTIRTTLGRKGISAHGFPTMPKYRGECNGRPEI